MTANKFKIEEVEEIQPVSEKTEKLKKPASGVKSILSGSFLSKEVVVDSLPFIFFMTFIGICYIANGYQAEKLIRKLYKTNTELKEMRSEYITSKSELMYLSKQSQVAQSTEFLGLKELTSPPNKIILSREEIEKINND